MVIGIGFAEKHRLWIEPKEQVQISYHPKGSFSDAKRLKELLMRQWEHGNLIQSTSHIAELITQLDEVLTCLVNVQTS